jgi:hypothetical protein
MSNDIYGYDPDDVVIRELLGEHFHEGLEQPVAEEPKEEKKMPPELKAACDAEWKPVKRRNFMDNLKECAISTGIFGGLNMLIFYWQQNELMASSVAVPCMWVVCALAGLGIGKVVGRK